MTPDKYTRIKFHFKTYTLQYAIWKALHLQQLIEKHIIHNMTFKKNTHLQQVIEIHVITSVIVESKNVIGKNVTEKKSRCRTLTSSCSISSASSSLIGTTLFLLLFFVDTSFPAAIDMTLGQSYKTFYSRNLGIFVIS